MKKGLIFVLAALVSSLSFAQNMTSSNMLRTNIGTAQLSNINSDAPMSRSTTWESVPTNTLASEPATVSLDLGSFWSNTLLRRAHHANMVSAADTHINVNRTFSPLSTQLNKGVNKGIILSADAKTITNTTVSASAIVNSNNALGSTNPELGEPTGLLGSKSRPSSEPIGFVPVGNGLAILLTLLGIYALVFRRRMQN